MDKLGAKVSSQAKQCCDPTRHKLRIRSRSLGQELPQRTLLAIFHFTASIYSWLPCGLATNANFGAMLQTPPKSRGPCLHIAYPLVRGTVIYTCQRAEQAACRDPRSHSKSPLSMFEVGHRLNLDQPLRARYRVLPRDGSVRTTKTSRVIARAMARGLGFVTPCPNKQGKNAYFSKVADASGTASDVVNVTKDCKHFGPPPPPHAAVQPGLQQPSTTPWSMQPQGSCRAHYCFRCACYALVVRATRLVVRTTQVLVARPC